MRRARDGGAGGGIDPGWCGSGSLVSPVRYFRGGEVGGEKNKQKEEAKNKEHKGGEQ